MKILAALPELSERQRRLLSILGYPTFGLVVFLVAVYASLPRDRLRERLERELSQDLGPPARAGTGMDVTIGDLGLSLVPLGVRLSDVALKQRNLPPGEGGLERKPQTFFIESIDVRTSLLDLLTGARSARVLVDAFGGQLQAEARLAGADVRAEVKAADIALARVPGLSQAVPLPLSGRAGLSLDLKGAIEPRSQRLITTSTAGLIEVSVDDGVIGDGKSKLVVPGDPFLAAGLTFPRVRLGKISGRVVIAKSRATFDQFRVKSPDAEASLEGYIELRDPFPLSELHLYLRFKPSAELSKREPTFELLVNGMAAGKRPDGFLGFSILGTVAGPVSRPAKEPPTGVSVRSAPLGMAQAGSDPPRRLPQLPPSALAPPASLPPPSADPPPPAPAVEAPPMPNYRSLQGNMEPRVSPLPAAPAVEAPPPPPAPEPAEAPGGAGSLPPPPTNYPSNQKGE